MTATPPPPPDPDPLAPPLSPQERVTTIAAIFIAQRVPDLPPAAVPLLRATLSSLFATEEFRQDLAAAYPY